MNTDKGKDGASILTLQVSRRHTNLNGVDDNDGLLLLSVLPTRIFRTGEHNVLNLTVLITNVSDHIDKTKRDNESNINDARYNKEGNNDNSNEKCIDYILILSSKLSKRTICSNERYKEDLLKHVEQIYLFNNENSIDDTIQNKYN